MALAPEVPCGFVMWQLKLQQQRLEELEAGQASLISWGFGTFPSALWTSVGRLRSVCVHRAWSVV